MGHNFYDAMLNQSMLEFRFRYDRSLFGQSGGNSLIEHSASHASGTKTSFRRRFAPFATLARIAPSSISRSDSRKNHPFRKFHPHFSLEIRILLLDKLATCPTFCENRPEAFTPRRFSQTGLDQTIITCASFTTSAPAVVSILPRHVSHSK